MTRLPLLLAAALALGACGTPPRNDPAGTSGTTGRPTDQRVRPDLSGRWQLDPEASDDAGARLRETRAEGGRGAPGGRIAPGSGAAPSSDPERRLLRHLSARVLQIEHRDPRLLIRPDNGAAHEWFTDNRGSSISALGDKSQAVGIAGWEAGTVVVETREAGERVIDRYRLLRDPRRLEVESELPGRGSEEQPLRIRRVFLPATP